MKQEQSGFIYIWYDRLAKMFYLGSHIGLPNDGYMGSSKWFKSAIKKRPGDFKRRILEIYNNIDRKDLLIRETVWLSKIKQTELGTKYYNFKRVATGGNIVGDLSEKKKQEHKEKSLAPRIAGYNRWLKENPGKLGELIKQWQKQNPEKVSENGRRRRAKVKNPSGGKNFGEKNGFYGKKHTQETKNLMKEKKNGKPSTRVLYNHSDDTKLKISLNSGNAVSINTPFGQYRSYEEFCRKYPITSDSALRIIMKNPNKVVSRYQTLRSKLFDEKDIGKTYKELGWFLNDNI